MFKKKNMNCLYCPSAMENEATITSIGLLVFWYVKSFKMDNLPMKLTSCNLLLLLLWLSKRQPVESSALIAFTSSNGYARVSQISILISQSIPVMWSGPSHTGLTALTNKWRQTHQGCNSVQPSYPISRGARWRRKNCPRVLFPTRRVTNSSSQRQSTTTTTVQKV